MRSQEDVLRSVGRWFSDVLGPAWEVRFAPEADTFKRPYCRVGFSGNRPNPSGPSHTTLQTRPLMAHLFPVVAETAEDATLQSLRLEEQIDRAVMVGAGRMPPPGVPVATPVVGTLVAGALVYRVTATARHGQSLPSPPVTFTSLGPGVAGGASLSWPAVPGARGYRVYRDGVLVAVRGVQQPSWVDDGSTTPSTSPLPTVDTSVVGGPRRIPLYDYDGVSLVSPATRRFFPDFLTVADVSVGSRVDADDERRITTVAELRVSWRRVGEREGGAVLQRVVSEVQGV